MKKTLKTSAILLLFLLTVTIFMQTLLPVFASDDTADANVPKVLTYTFTDASPIVNAPELFLSIYEETCDIHIVGERAAWTFFYENIFRSTGKWHPFSAAVTVKSIAEAEVHASVKSALSGALAYFVDFSDNDLYPGTAQVEIKLSDVLSSDQSYTVYDYIKNADGTVSLRPIAEHMKLSANGTWSFTVTEAHDLLITGSDDAAAAALSAYAYTPKLAAEKTSGSSLGDNIGWTIFFTVVGVGIAVFVIYIATVRVIKANRRKNAVQKKGKNS